MASQNRPLSAKNAPDPATTYERAKPENENGQGDLDRKEPDRQEKADHHLKAITNNHPPRQVNAEDGSDPRSAEADRSRPTEKVDHSMKDEEPLGWDQAPIGQTRPEAKRHPKKEGKGGTE